MERRVFVKLAATAGATAVLGGCAADTGAGAGAPADAAPGPDGATAPEPETPQVSPEPEPETPAAEAASGAPYDGVFPAHEPLGTGVGVHPGRVAWAFDPAAVSWDGSGFWWDPANFDEAAVQALVDGAVAALAGEESVPAAWEALFAAHNEARGTEGGYRAGQKVAIKVNINGSGVFGDDDSGETNMSYTTPVLLRCVLRALVRDAGVAAEDITVYDAARLFPRPMVALCSEGELSGVAFVGRDTVRPDEGAPIAWSRAFSGSTCYVPTCVTEADYLVNLSNLKGHSYGITLSGKNHFGSFYNGNTLRPPEGANLHQFLYGGEMGAYNPIVDLLANEHLGAKAFLYLMDGLICAPSEGASITKENATWRQDPFNGSFAASVLASQDALAIDSVGADLLMNEPAVIENNGALRGNPVAENYLHEAALAENGEAATPYDSASSASVARLGVHEHWNNSADKLYSRNLGKPEGIELVRV